MRIGMIGDTGSLISIMAKRMRVRKPKMMSVMTIADVHGRVTPPRRSPKRSISVPPTMLTAPSQSIAFKPATSGVFGVLRSRNIRMIMNASPSSGTIDISLICYHYSKEYENGQILNGHNTHS